MRISKEVRFIITSIVLSLGFLGINFVPDQSRLLSIFFLTFATIILFVFSLWEGLGINESLLSLILPPLFTLGVGIFWFLIPTSIFARLPVVILFGLGIYVLCRTENIFTVSMRKTIPLFRGARSVGFILTYVTSFLLYNALISIKANIFITALGVALISMFLFLQGLWISSIEIKNLNLNKMFLYAGVFTLALTEVGIILYFWPVTVVVGSVFLTIGIYVLLGLGQAELEDRLFKLTVRDHLIVGVIVFFIMFLATHWG
ncbi:MAG TPA: hypothetical protein VG895_01545 [Patescibacteria group bacterium]|nr:hypothetical protein [Patescibacteria group bacterium]